MPSVMPHPDVLVPPPAAWSQPNHVWLLAAACPLQRCKVGHLCIAEVCFFPQNLLESHYLSDALLLSQPMTLVHMLKSCLGKRRRRWMDSVTISALFPSDTQLRIKLFIACVKHFIAV